MIDIQTSKLDVTDYDIINSFVEPMVLGMKRRLEPGGGSDPQKTRERTTELRRSFGQKFAAALTRHPAAEREEYAFMFEEELRRIWDDAMRDEQIDMHNDAVRRTMENAYYRVIMSLSVIVREETEKELKPRQTPVSPVIRVVEGVRQEFNGAI